MGIQTSPACKYKSFNALIRINEPELLYEVFLEQLDAGESPRVELFERSEGGPWRQLQANGKRNELPPASEQRRLLERRIDPEREQQWFYEPARLGWFCAYKPCSRRQYAMFYAPEQQRILDEDYVQLLFSVYCHQFTGIEGVFRDSLTGLYNRRAFDQRMHALIEHSRQPMRRSRLSQPAVFAMVDIDHFKRVNDQHGHVVGDELLAEIAGIMSESFREYDLLFRYGGEEFALVLMDMDEAMSQQALERFRRRIADSDFPRQLRVTVSIGYCLFDAGAGIQGLIDRADQALYASKRNGRNQVQRFPLS